MSLKKSYTSISVVGDKLVADYTSSADKLPKLEPGIYTIHYDPIFATFWFKSFHPTSDHILDLPSSEYQQITQEMSYFLRPEVRAKFNDMGYIYKRSTLLYGLPGTGKTCIVNRIAKEVVKSGGIVIYNDKPDILKMAFEVLNDLQPETLTLAVFEEFDNITKYYEKHLLTLLDGEVQKANVMFLATTNYLDRIPKRLYRPGRFASVIEIQFPTLEARRQYLIHKLGDNPNVNFYAENTQDFSIDELKEVIQSVEILGNDFRKTIDRLKATRDLAETEQKNYTNIISIPSLSLKKDYPRNEDDDIFDEAEDA